MVNGVELVVRRESQRSVSGTGELGGGRRVVREVFGVGDTTENVTDLGTKGINSWTVSRREPGEVLVEVEKVEQVEGVGQVEKVGQVERLGQVEEVGKVEVG